jgi:phage-related protein
LNPATANCIRPNPEGMSNGKSVVPIDFVNIFVIIHGMEYTITYYDEDVQTVCLSLPTTLRARYASLTLRMQQAGPNLGEPHTKALGNGLFELRLKGREGIARVFYCVRVGRRIVMLHGFIKKTSKTPLNERQIAEKRMKEIKNDDARSAD